MNKFILFLLFSTEIFLGFLREFTFFHINLRIYQLLYEPTETHRSILIAFLDPLTSPQLHWLKLMLTFVFPLFFYLVGGFILIRLFEFSCWKIFGVAYGGLIIPSILVYLVFLLFGNALGGYTIARFFMGLAQSPFPLVFMIPALKLWNPSRAQ